MNTKSTFFYALVTLLSFSLMSSTCSSDDDDNMPNSSVQDATMVSQSGSWKISSFIDSGQNETNHFTGYTFTFGDNGELTATNGSNTLTGSWSITNSNSNDDSSNDSDMDFNIFFPVDDSNAFEDLNDDWDISSYDDNTIDLIDVSGGNGGTDTLTFTKL